MDAGLCEDLEQVVEVVAGDGLLQLREDLLSVGAVRLDKLLLLVLGLDVGLALFPGTEKHKVLALLHSFLNTVRHVDHSMLYC